MAETIRSQARRGRACCEHEKWRVKSVLWGQKALSKMKMLRKFQPLSHYSVQVTLARVCGASIAEAAPVSLPPAAFAAD